MEIRAIELNPFDYHKSFYKKAFAGITDTENPYKNVFLKSYDTVVCYFDENGKFHRTWDGYSATTMRHVNAFIETFGGGRFKGKAFWESCPVEESPVAEF